MAAFPCLNCESPIDLLAFGGFFYPSSLFASAGLGVIVNLSAMAISSLFRTVGRALGHGAGFRKGSIATAWFDQPP